MSNEMITIVLRIRLRTIFAVIAAVVLVSAIFVALSLVGTTSSGESQSEIVDQPTAVSMATVSP